MGVGGGGYHEKSVYSFDQSNDSISVFLPIRYVYRGWRKDLQEADLFHLNPRDSSKVLVPPFEQEWGLEQRRFKEKQ